MSVKVQRIASDIQKVIAEAITNECRDELLKTVTITHVDVTNDLSFAKVYFTSLTDNMPIKSLEKELNEAAPFFRMNVSKNMEIRHTPELHFIFDTSIAQGNHIEHIIKEIHEKETNE